MAPLSDSGRHRVLPDNVRGSLIDQRPSERIWAESERLVALAARGELAEPLAAVVRYHEQAAAPALAPVAEALATRLLGPTRPDDAFVREAHFRDGDGVARYLRGIGGQLDFDPAFSSLLVLDPDVVRHARAGRGDHVTCCGRQITNHETSWRLAVLLVPPASPWSRPFCERCSELAPPEIRAVIGLNPADAVTRADAFWHADGDALDDLVTVARAAYVGWFDDGESLLEVLAEDGDVAFHAAVRVALAETLRPAAAEVVAARFLEELGRDEVRPDDILHSLKLARHIDDCYGGAAPRASATDLAAAVDLELWAWDDDDFDERGIENDMRVMRDAVLLARVWPAALERDYEWSDFWRGVPQSEVALARRLLAQGLEPRAASFGDFEYV